MGGRWVGMGGHGKQQENHKRSRMGESGVWRGFCGERTGKRQQPGVYRGVKVEEKAERGM